MVLAGVDATLDADLGRTALDRVLALPENLFVAAVEGFVFVAVAREAAKRTSDVTDVREVDVPAHDVGDVFAVVPLACEVRRRDQGMEIRALGAEQPLGALFSELFSREGALQEVAHVGTHGSG